MTKLLQLVGQDETDYGYVFFQLGAGSTTFTPDGMPLILKVGQRMVIRVRRARPKRIMFEVDVYQRKIRAKKEVTT